MYSSKYIHQIDTKHKIYYISFAPIVSTLTTTKTDHIILGENSVGTKGQLLYDFIQLNPGTFYELAIDSAKLFKNRFIKNNAIKYFDHYSISKFKSANFKNSTTSKLKDDFDLVLQFSVFNNIQVVCDKSQYYLNEFEFDRKSKEFKMINLKVKELQRNFSPNPG